MISACYAVCGADPEAVRSAERGTEQRTVWVFRAALRTREQAGRKPDRETVQAADLWTSGMLLYRTGPTEYPTLKRYRRDVAAYLPRSLSRLPGASTSSPHQYRATGPRRNVEAYLNRKGHKAPLGNRDRTANMQFRRLAHLPQTDSEVMEAIAGYRTTGGPPL